MLEIKSEIRALIASLEGADPIPYYKIVDKLNQLIRMLDDLEGE